MLKTAVDASEKLFGRRFLFVAFIPSLICILGTFTVWYGSEAIANPLQELASGGWSKFAFAIVVTVAISLLLAFVILGSLGTIRAAYRGDWPTPFLNSVLGGWFLRRQMDALQRLHNDEARLSRCMNDAGWATLLQFQPSQDVDIIKSTDVKARVEVVAERRRLLVARLEKNGTLADREYEQLLADARALQSSQTYHPDLFDASATTVLQNLVKQLRMDYARLPQLKAIAELLQQGAERKYRRAFSDLAANFSSEGVWIRPTHLGNVAAAIETYPLKRYGIDWDAIWPRILFVLPRQARQQVDSATMMVDFALVMSFVSWLMVVAVLLGIPLGIAGYVPWHLGWPTLFEAAVALGAGWLFLGVAVQATFTLGEQTQAAMDLYRLQLIDALQIQRPKTPGQERAIWEKLRQFIASEDPLPNTIRFRRKRDTHIDRAEPGE